MNEFLAASGMFEIPRISAIADISTSTSFLRIGDAWDSRDFSDCRDFHMNKFFVALRMLGIPGISAIAEISI